MRISLLTRAWRFWVCLQLCLFTFSICNCMCEVLLAFLPEGNQGQDSGLWLFTGDLYLETVSLCSPGWSGI